MRIFENFSENVKCPICGTNEDKECVLIPVAGTAEGNNIQAKEVHLECLVSRAYFYPKNNIIAVECIQ